MDNENIYVADEIQTDVNNLTDEELSLYKELKEALDKNQNKQCLGKDKIVKSGLDPLLKAKGPESLTNRYLRKKESL